MATLNPAQTAYIRGHCHDVRNRLNGIELEAVLMETLLEDPDALRSLSAVRKHVQAVEVLLARLSIRFTAPTRAVVNVFPLLERCRYRACSAGVTAELDWTLDVADTYIVADEQALGVQIHELLEFGFGKRGGTVSATHTSEEVHLELTPASVQHAGQQEKERLAELKALMARQGGRLEGSVTGNLHVYIQSVISIT